MKLKSEDISVKNKCFHCGDECNAKTIALNDKQFCCNGCKNVYQLLNKNHLENYYCLNESPGISLKEINTSKFQYLDTEEIAKKIITFSNQKVTQVTLYLPQIHCSSCLWLLENLTKIDSSILSSQVNFNSKQISISFYHQNISLRHVVELLSKIGYEPHISLNEINEKKNTIDNSVSIKIGIAGFCFANIMLISFPEYLGLDYSSDKVLTNFFRYLNLGIALPVFFYCAKEFFINAYKSIIQNHLNIDAPIALAIIITFLRSVFEIFTNAGAGYLDSMSGIVFFMLIGRALQNKTQKTLKFNRDYKSYFPVAVTIIESGNELTQQIENIKIDDVLLLHHQEIIPVDCILSKGKAEIDYSFITGENTSQLVNVGELIYSGGKVISSKIEVITAKPFSQNSFTQLWNNSIFKNKTESSSFVNILSKYFSLALFGIAFITFIYWFYVNPSIALNAFTAVLIVACPCSLLLTSSFTFGYIIEVFNNKGLFVKGAQTIEEMSNSTHIVFDKTGTLTEANSSNIIYYGAELIPEELSIVISCMKQSMHPLSKVIAEKFSNKYRILNIINIKEIKGEGIEAWVDDKHIKIGNREFTKAITNVNELASRVYISIDNNIKGCFIIENKIKDNVQDLIHELKDFSLSLLSGDNESSKGQMEKIFPNSSELNFNQSPINKLDYILKLQNNGKKVIMVGDGLNDAGALKQSNCGISIVQNYFSFSPACDGILEAKNLYRFSSFIKSSVAAKKLIKLTFVFSIFYNIIGLSFAVSGNLQPVIAAILMPASSISIILISYFGTKAIEKKYF